MNEKERAAYQTTLNHALEEKRRLDATIDYLTQKLGGNPAPGMELLPITVTPLSRVGAVAATALVNPGEFFGMSGTKASRRLLERVGPEHPMHTDELFAAIKKGGARIGGSSTLYKVLSRDAHTFQRVGRSTWGLKAWYPGSKTRPKDELREEPEIPDD